MTIGKWPESDLPIYSTPAPPVQDAHRITPSRCCLPAHHATQILDAWEEERIIEWAKASAEWVHETFRHCHKAIIALHTDEASPHIHVMMIPETENARLGWTLVKPEVTGHETDHYRHLQNDFHERVSQRFGLDRGEVGSKRKHKPLTREAGIAAAREELDVGRELQRRLSKVADLADASMQPDKAAVIRQAAEDPDRLLEEMAQRNMERAERQAGPAFKQRLAELQKQEEEAEREAERKIAENKARVAASKLQAERWDAICRKKPSVFRKLLASAGG